MEEEGDTEKKGFKQKHLEIESLQRWEGQNWPPGEDSGAFPT